MRVGNFFRDALPVAFPPPTRRAMPTLAAANLASPCSKTFMTLATDQNTEGRGLSATALQFMALRDAVMDFWEREVRKRVEGARHLLGPVLTNTLPAFFDNIAEALSPSHPRSQGASDNNSPTAHGNERARMTPFGPDQVIHEYQIFREAIAWVAKGRLHLGETEWTIINRSIDEATREAIRAFTKIHEELRRKVAAALSHDMRTPLSVIGHGAQLVARAPTLDLARQAASKIESNSARLNDMMGDLLDCLTSQGRAKLPLRLGQFDMFKLASEVREQYAHLPDCGADFEVDGESVMGHWDEGAMRRAIENLVNNAIKYGDGGVVKIVAQQTRGRMMLTVHNEGQHIPKDRHERIFEYLVREDNSTSAEGWGVGLPFVKAMAEAHGGSVTVDSSPQTGTTFLIDVPVDCRPHIDHQAPASL
jgi:signal transduction histidine kinase